MGDNPATQRYAVVGAGLAGLATTWHLLQRATAQQRIHVDVYDSVGIAAGGSGAAAGLLHPLTPRGKLLWRGPDAMRDALELVEVAEAAAARCAAAESANAGAGHPANGQFVWRFGMVRPAASLKQAKDFAKNSAPVTQGAPNAGVAKAAVSNDFAEGVRSESRSQSPRLRTSDADSLSPNHSAPAAKCIPAREAQALVPGLTIRMLDELAKSQPDSRTTFSSGFLGVGAPLSVAEAPSNGSTVEQQNRRQQRKRQAEHQQFDPTSSAALMVTSGVVLQPQEYLQHLWQACLQSAAGPGSVCSVAMHRRGVTSLRELRSPAGSSYDAVVLAAGAAIGTIDEVAAAGLPLDLCQGYTLDMHAPDPEAPEASGGSVSSSHKCSNGSEIVEDVEEMQPPAAESAARTLQSSSSSGSDSCGGSSNGGDGDVGCLPSILGQPYIAFHGSQRSVVGATKRHGLSPQQALQECGRLVGDSVEAAAAVQVSNILVVFL